MNVAVVGAGTMGHGIAAAAAAGGHAVSLTDADELVRDQAEDQLRHLFAKSVAKQKMTDAEGRAALGRIRIRARTGDAVSGAALVIEAVPERLGVKQALFAGIEPLVDDITILASNTSSLSISEIAAPLRRPERVVGLHFFNPVVAMKLVEVVRGRATAEPTVVSAKRFAESLGKTAIVVNDTPGFATSRLGIVLGLEAIRMVEQGVASPDDIDRAMVLGYNHPVGPLRLGDLVGLDVRLAIADHLHATLGDDTYRAPALLRRMVSEGKLGQKSGQGFYRWDARA